MQRILALFFLFSGTIAFAQKSPDILATSTGVTYTSETLSPEVRKVYENRDKIIADARSQALSAMTTGALLDLEAKATNRTAEQILATERAKVVAPTAEQIQAFYDENSSSLGGKTLDEVQKQIADYLHQQSEQKAVEAFVKGLEAKYKVAPGKDVDAIGLRPTDVLVTVGAKPITVAEFEQKNKAPLYEMRAQIFDEVNYDLEAAVFSALVAEEAKARGVETNDLIAAEITDKLKEYTEDERAGLERALMKQLFAKYKVKMMLKAPPPLVQNISVDDDPVLGNAAAPVTVVMFTDFQCPACSATHPVLKKVLATYGSKVRLVVRDFPLQRLHPNAFLAAMAANAALAQGKFADYIDVLYHHQDALDRDSLIKYAGDLGLNTKKFALDLSDEKVAAEIRKDIADGTSYGAGGTPTIFVNGVKVRRLSADGFRQAIDDAMARAQRAAAPAKR